MRLKHLVITGLAGLALAIAATAAAQGGPSAVRGNPAVGGPSANTMQRGGRTAALTPAGCEGLGGRIRFGSPECGTPFICVTESRTGTLSTICIDEYDRAGTAPTAPGTHNPAIGQSSVQRPGATRQPGRGAVTGQPATVATPLTANECRALGGVVVEDTNNVCSRADRICARQGPTGWHQVCINES